MKKPLKNEEIRHKLPALLDKVCHLIFLTSGQCIIFDKNEEQISELQAEFTSGETNKWLLKQVAEHAGAFTIGKFRGWMQDINKEDFLRITHLHCD